MSPRAKRTSFEGGVSPRARRTLLEGAPCWVTLVGRGGHHGVSRAVCVCFVLGSRCVLRFVFFAGFKQDSPRFFRGPSWLSPTISALPLKLAGSLALAQGKKNVLAH
jgi:hypothetical protein